MATLEARFWSKVDRAGPIAAGMTTPCWIWTGAIHADTGYGAFRDADGRTRHAHRIAFRIHIGAEAPDGLDVCHQCDVRHCVRADHLFVGSRRDNMQDARQKGRSVLPPIMRGVANPKARLDDARVREIRRRYAAGEKQAEIAKRFGVSQPAISKIVRGEWWTHVV